MDGAAQPSGTEGAAPFGLRVVICDDHRVLREAVAAYLLDQPGIASVSTAGNADEAVRLVRAGADVLVLDLLLGHATTSLDALEALHNLGARVPTLLMSASEDHELIAEAMDLGAAGFCPKQVPPDVFLTSLFRVAAGEVVLPASAVARVTQLLERNRAERRRSEAMLARMTSREVEVLKLLADGVGRDDIAKRLHISTNTVRTHLRSIMEKLGVHSQVAAAAVGRTMFATLSGHRVITLPDAETSRSQRPQANPAPNG